MVVKVKEYIISNTLAHILLFKIQQSYSNLADFHAKMQSIAVFRENFLHEVAFFFIKNERVNCEY